MNNVKVIKELRRLAKRNEGLLLPEQVVEAARPKRSVLHSHFEWDDTAAAREYRLWQARRLISVCVEIVPNVNEPLPVFVSLRSDRGRGGGYRTTANVMSDAEAREQLLKDALHDLNTFQRKYSALRQLAAVFEAIRKLRSAA